VTARRDFRPGELWLVTGASSGIGRELAKTLAQRSQSLALSGRNVEALEAVRTVCLDLGAREARIFPEDLAAPEAPKRLARAVRDSMGDPVGLVNDAGISTSEPVVQIPLPRMREQVAVNLQAPLALTRLLAPAMGERNRGFILNVASVAGFQALPRQAVYAATKGFIVSWTAALRRELLPFGIHVTALCPGLTRTPFFDRSGLDVDNRLAGFRWAWHDAGDVARAGIAGVRRNRMQVAPGLFYTMSVTLTRLLPRSCVRRLVAWGCHD